MAYVICKMKTRQKKKRMKCYAKTRFAYIFICFEVKIIFNNTFEIKFLFLFQREKDCFKNFQILKESMKTYLYMFIDQKLQGIFTKSTNLFLKPGSLFVHCLHLESSRISFSNG